ncbi:hypothetical protein GGI35DRAFT_453414 [Trichoderma velutinum]
MHKHKHKHKGREDTGNYMIDEVSKKSDQGPRRKGAVKTQPRWFRRGKPKSKAATRTREAQHDDIAGLSYRLRLFFSSICRARARNRRWYASLLLLLPTPGMGEWNKWTKEPGLSLATWVSLDIRGPQAWVSRIETGKRNKQGFEANNPKKERNKSSRRTRSRVATGCYRGGPVSGNAAIRLFALLSRLPFFCFFAFLWVRQGAGVVKVGMGGTQRFASWAFET